MAPAVAASQSGSSQGIVAAAPVAPVSRAARGWGRVSFMAQGVSAKDDGQSLPSFSELVTTATWVSPTPARDGTEFRVDFRASAYPQAEERDPRVSAYDAWVGRRFAGGNVAVRVGQMWLNDLGGLGSVGGGLVEVTRPKTLGHERVRIGAFGGLEPRVLDLGFVDQLTKAGGYVAFEGSGSRRHVLGYVNLRNSSLTERSVLTTTNFLPIGRRVFVYQAAEFDLKGPGGEGSGGLTYFFANARVSPIERLEIQGIYHRGRSIDARSITLDLLNGRPVSARALEGFLYESAGTRVTVTLARSLRVFGGYARDKNNRDDEATTRTTAGLWSSNLFGTGIDLRATQSRVQGPRSEYDAWDLSLGRSLGSRVYVTFDYSSSLSVFRFESPSVYVVETRPRAARFGGTAIVNLTRMFSLLGSIDRYQDGTLEEWRWLSGITVRY